MTTFFDLLFFFSLALIVVLDALVPGVASSRTLGGGCVDMFLYSFLNSVWDGFFGGQASLVNDTRAYGMARRVSPIVGMPMS